MEGYSNEDSKSLSDESNDENNIGMGRSYECVFCKRGFTTAQALGGHMNIHRKDRSPSANSKMNPRRMSNNNSVLVPSVTSNHKVHSSFPAPTWLIATSSSSLPHRHHQDLSLQLGLSSEDDGKDMGHAAGRCEEDDLDLELRLGYA